VLKSKMCLNRYGSTTHCHLGGMTEEQRIKVQEGELDYRFGKWRQMKSRCLYEDIDEALFTEELYRQELLSEQLHCETEAEKFTIDYELAGIMNVEEELKERRLLSK